MRTDEISLWDIFSVAILRSNRSRLTWFIPELYCLCNAITIDFCNILFPKHKIFGCTWCHTTDTMMLLKWQQKRVETIWYWIFASCLQSKNNNTLLSSRLISEQIFDWILRNWLNVTYIVYLQNNGKLRQFVAYFLFTSCFPYFWWCSLFHRPRFHFKVYQHYLLQYSIL